MRVERLPLLAATLLPFGLAYFASYFLRTINAVIAPDLVRELELTAGSLGLLTAAYFMAFCFFQIPLGLLLDRYGPRRVNAALFACAAVGAWFFAAATSIQSLTLARALIGLGAPPD
jgi:MFS family permease